MPGGPRLPPVPDPAALVDLDRYPVLDPDGAGAAMVAAPRRRARATPACRSCPGSSAPTPLPGARRASATRWPAAPSCRTSRARPYLELPDADAWPAGHPRVTWARSAVHTVAYDRFSPTRSGLRALFEWDALLDVVSRILGRAPLHRYADPLGAMNLAVMHEGDTLGWHFDQTDFVVSLALQAERRRGRVRERAAAAVDRRRRASTSATTRWPACWPARPRSWSPPCR